MSIQVAPADYTPAVLDLLPPGPAWPRTPGLPLYGVAAAIAHIESDVNTNMNALVDVESDPAQTVGLLDDWLLDWGFPDPCLPLGSSFQAQRLALLGKMAQQGGQSRAYYIAVAAALGRTITISEFASSRAGVLRAGDALHNAAWDNAWQIHADAVPVTYFHAGASVAGDSLGSFGDDTLQCVISRIAPAQTTLIFGYG